MQYGLLLTLDGLVSLWNLGYISLAELRLTRQAILPKALTVFTYILITIMVTTATKALSMPTWIMEL